MFLVILHHAHHLQFVWGPVAMFLKQRERPDLISQFADYQRYELNHAERTVRVYVQRLGYIEETTGKPIYKVTADDLRAIKRTSTLSSESVKGWLVAAHAFHKWGALEGFWPLNGISLVRTPKVTNESSSPLPVAKAKLLIAACRTPLEHRLVYGGLYAGMRVGESAVISGEMWDDGVLRFRGLKNKRIRNVPIHPDLEAVKWQMLAHPPSTESSLQKIKRRMQAQVGFEFVTHQLRKCFATQLYEAGVDDRIVKQLLGHSPDVTARYVEVSGRRLKEAIDCLVY